MRHVLNRYADGSSVWIVAWIDRRWPDGIASDPDEPIAHVELTGGHTHADPTSDGSYNGRDVILRLAAFDDYGGIPVIVEPGTEPTEPGENDPAWTPDPLTTELPRDVVGAVRWCNDNRARVIALYELHARTGCRNTAHPWDNEPTPIPSSDDMDRAERTLDDPETFEADTDAS